MTTPSCIPHPALDSAGHAAAETDTSAFFGDNLPPAVQSHVLDYVDDATRKSLGAVANKGWMDALTCPTTVAAQRRLQRAIRARQSDPVRLDKLLNGSCAAKVLPHLTPPLFAANTSLDVVFRLIDDCYELPNPEDATTPQEVLSSEVVALADATVTAQARTTRHLAALNLAGHGNVFSYIWSGFLPLHLALSPAVIEDAWSAIQASLRGAEVADLDVVVTTSNNDDTLRPPAVDASAREPTIATRDGIAFDLQAHGPTHFNSFAPEDVWSRLRPALDGAGATLQVLRLRWSDVIDNAGEATARNLIQWLPSLTALSELDLLGGGGCHTEKPTALALMFAIPRYSLPNLSTLHVAGYAFEPYATGLQRFVEDGDLAFTSLKNLHLEGFAFVGDAMSDMWTSLGCWSKQLDTLTVCNDDLRSMQDAQLDALVSATAMIKNVTICSERDSRDGRAFKHITAGRPDPQQTSWELSRP